MSKKTTIKILVFLLVLALIVLGTITALIIIANKNNVTIATQWHDWLVALKLVKQTTSNANIALVRC